MHDGEIVLGTMTFRWLIVAQSPSAYTLLQPSTLNHSSVARARLLAYSEEIMMSKEQMQCIFSLLNDKYQLQEKHNMEA